MENNNKAKKFIKELPTRLKDYFHDYFKNLNYPLWILMILISIGLFLLDYFTKRAAYNDPRLQAGEIITLIPGLIDLNLVGNAGAAFGSMSGWSWFLIPVSMIASIMLTINLVLRFRKYNWGMTIGITLMLPGAVGNLIDRIGFACKAVPYDKGVIDFLQFSFWKSFAICNIADYCLTVGIIVLLIGFFFEFKKEYKLMKEEEEKEKQEKESPEALQEKEEMTSKLSELEKKESESLKEDIDDGNKNIQE